MINMDYRKIVNILLLKGYTEECPTKDYDTMISYHSFFRYPFTVKIMTGLNYFNVASYRLDKQYTYGKRLGQLRIIK